MALLLLVAAGVLQAGFAWPMRYFRGWRWEHVWIGQALSSNLVLPLALLFCLPASLRAQLGHLGAAHWAILVGLGVAWGLGGIGYGMSLALLGLSFTYSLVFSVTTLVGALGPGSATPAHSGIFFAGLGLCVLGAVAMAQAGQRRQADHGRAHAQSMDLVTPLPPLSYPVALTLALVAGVFSAAMGLALGMNGAPVRQAIAAGLSPLAAAMVVWVPLYAGSASAALVYGGACVWRARTLPQFWRAAPLRNWSLIAVMGLLGCGGVLLYGWGASGAGHPAPGRAWGLYMAVFILSGNGLGVGAREWRGCSRRTYLWLVAGVLPLLAAIALLAR